MPGRFRSLSPVPASVHCPTVATAARRATPPRRAGAGRCWRHAAVRPAPLPRLHRRWLRYAATCIASGVRVHSATSDADNLPRSAGRASRIASGVSGAGCQHGADAFGLVRRMGYAFVTMGTIYPSWLGERRRDGLFVKTLVQTIEGRPYVCVYAANSADWVANSLHPCLLTLTPSGSLDGDKERPPD